MELCEKVDKTKFGDCLVSSIPRLLDWEQSYLEKKLVGQNRKNYTPKSQIKLLKIWSLCKSWRTIEAKDEYEELCFSFNKMFIDFVKNLEKSNPLIEAYSWSLENVGSFPFWRYSLNNIRDYPDKIDLENRGVQILLAIHFLTITISEKGQKGNKTRESGSKKKE